MGGHAGRFVDDHHIGVVVEHRQSVDRLRGSRIADRVGQPDLEQRAVSQPRGPRRQAPVDQHVARIDEGGGRGPRQAEQTSHRDVQPNPDQPLGHRKQPSRAHDVPAPRFLPSRSMPRSARDGGQDRPANDGRVGQVEDRPDVPVIGEQADPVDDVAAAPARRSQHPIGEVAERAAEHEPERHGPARRVQAARGPQDDHHHDDGDDREHDRRAGADRERRAGIAGQAPDRRLHRAAARAARAPGWRPRSTC